MTTTAYRRTVLERLMEIKLRCMPDLASPSGAVREAARIACDALDHEMEEFKEEVGDE